MSGLYSAIQRHSQEILGGTSIGSFGTAITIASINQYLQFVALLVSIITGGIVIYKHFWGKNNGDSESK